MSLLSFVKDLFTPTPFEMTINEAAEVAPSHKAAKRILLEVYHMERAAAMSALHMGVMTGKLDPHSSEARHFDPTEFTINTASYSVWVSRSPAPYFECGLKHCGSQVFLNTAWRIETHYCLDPEAALHHARAFKREYLARSQRVQHFAMPSQPVRAQLVDARSLRLSSANRPSLR